MAIPFNPPLTAQELQAAFPDLEVTGTLGVGGQGATFKVNSRSSGDQSALKLYSTDTLFVRVDNEIEKLRAIRSPYVVRLLQHGEVGIRGKSVKYGLMEFVPGVSLNPPMSDSEVRHLLHDVAHGIEDMWRARVVHRDLKPDNLLRRDDGRFVIIDLGVAKHLDKQTVTRAGYTCGTWGFMSPEQSEGRKGLTYRSDLFALGIVAYIAGSGRHPFFQEQSLIGSYRPEPLDSIAPHVSDETSALIGRLLNVDPVKRPKFVEIYSLRS